jgi:hypothetical protein
MHASTHALTLWAVLAALTGAVVAVVVYLLTDDVVWALVPLLLTVAPVRGLLRRDTDG